MVSHPELGSNPPIGSDWESGCDRNEIMYINDRYIYEYMNE